MTADKGRAAAGEHEEATFEKALARLEEIVEELERTDLSLEETLARYEEGSRLVRTCTRRLEEAEQRIRQLAGSDAPSGAGASGAPSEGDAADADDGLPF
jgi:exodeoxyribonuclease VII small subunit